MVGIETMRKWEIIITNHLIFELDICLFILTTIYIAYIPIGEEVA